jgi:hypothetical protein
MPDPVAVRLGGLSLANTARRTQAGTEVGLRAQSLQRRLAAVLTPAGACDASKRARV